MLAREQHVLGLDVTVHDLVTMGICQRVEHVAQDADGVGDGQRTPPGEPRAQGLALDQRHGVVQQPAAFAGREDRHHVGVLQRRREPDLLPEPVDAHRRAQLRGEHLHDDLATEPALVGDEHAAHPAAAELTFHSVAVTESTLKAGQKVGHEVLKIGSAARGCAAP